MQLEDINREDQFLKLYCYYPLNLAEEEYYSSMKDKYRITTIDWKFASDIETGKIDLSYVHKNIYEMSLKEFLKWYKDVCGEEVVIGIERLGSDLSQEGM